MNKLQWLLFFFLPVWGFGQKPALVVPVGHIGAVKSLAFSPACPKGMKCPFGDRRLILTSAWEDPTAKLWDLNGNELQSFPINKGDIRSVAFSPTCPEGMECPFGNGRTILVTGENTARLWTLNGQTVQAFEKILEKASCAIFAPDGQAIITGSKEGVVKSWNPNGQEMQSFKAHNDVVSEIVFSPDGQFMITQSFGENTGRYEQKLWDLPKQKLLQDLGRFSSLVFDPNSQYILEKGFGIADTLELLDLKGQTIKTFEAVTGADFSPDGRFVLVESRYEATKFWHVGTKEFQTFGQGTSFAFSSDGQLLLYENKDSGVVQLLDLNTKESQTFEGFPNGVSLLEISPNKQFFLTSERNRETTTLKLLNIKTKAIQASTSFSRPISFLRFSPDSQSLLFKNDQNGNEFHLEVLNGKLEKKGTLKGYVNSMSDAFFSSDGTAIVINDYPANKAWELKTHHIQPTHQERPFYSGFTGDVLWSPDRNYIFGSSADEPNPGLYESAGGLIQTFDGHAGTIHSAAFSADGHFLLSGSSDNTAKLWDLQGECLQTFVGHSGAIWSVGFAPDNQIILTGTDKMAKLWRADSGQEIISLIQIDSADWIVTTPSGLFDATPNALNLMHYSLFYERDQEYIVIDVEQLKARYYEPGLLQKRLGYSDEHIRQVEAFDVVKLYPKVKAEIINDSLNIHLRARNGGIGRVSIFINNKEIVEEVNPLPRYENAKRDSIIKYDLKQHQNYLFRHPDSTNVISIRAYNEEGWLKSRILNLDYKITQARTRGTENTDESTAWVGTLDPKLYAISIGTSDYTGSKMDLQYADQDATMMARALQSVGTALFTNGDSLEVHCLSTADIDSTGVEGTPIQWQFADKNQIKATFETIKAKAKAEDVIVVYLSGHGVTYGSAELAQFHYLTQGIASEDLSDASIRQAYTISSEELTKWINDIPALKQVLIIDACNSGQIVKNLTGGTKALNSSQIRALDRMKDRTGMFILSGSASDKVSYEAGEYGQGLLTYALLQGMLGMATRKTEEGDYIDVMKLFQHARDEVPRLAASINGIQTPMLGFPAMGASFDIGILDDSAKVNIPIGNKKPVLIRSTFLNQTTFKDDLQLADRLEAAFLKETKKGREADLIYVDVYHYPNAYSLSGLYETQGSTINIQVKLFKGEQPPIDLELRPTDDPERLVTLILRAVKKELARERDKAE